MNLLSALDHQLLNAHLWQQRYRYKWQLLRIVRLHLHRY